MSSVKFGAPDFKNRGRGTLRITESPGHPSLSVERVFSLTASVEHSELHDNEAGDQPEVPHVGRQQGIANLQRRCSDQQVPEGDNCPSTLLLSVDLACQQRRFFGVGIDFDVV